MTLERTARHAQPEILVSTEHAALVFSAHFDMILIKIIIMCGKQTSSGISVHARLGERATLSLFLTASERSVVIVDPG